MKRLKGFVNGVVTALLVLVLLGVGAMAFTAKRAPDGVPNIYGYRALSVISGSMEPAIDTGDVIVIRPVTAIDEITDGTVITYRSKEDREMLITHRVVGTVKVNGEPKAFVTKGDANDGEDLTPVTFEQIVGRYQFRVPYLGYISTFVRTPAGVVLVVILPGLLLIGMEFRKIYLALAESEAAEWAKAEEATGKRE